MSICSNVTEQDLNILRKLADQQKNQRAHEIKNRFSKQTQDIKLAESLSSTTRQIDEVKETTQNLGELVLKSDVENGNTQTLALEKITATQSLRDTLSFLKRSRNFFKLEAKDNGDVFWNKVLVKAKRENRINIKDEDYVINPTIQLYFTNTKLTTKPLDNEDKLTVFNSLENVAF